MRFCATESLGEYGSGWEWDNNAHVLDQASEAGIPFRYDRNGYADLSHMDWYTCKDDVEESYGVILESGSHMSGQIACRPHSGNIGNYYTWTASIIKYINEENGDSVCPKGWKIPNDSEYGAKNFYHMATTIYNIRSIDTSMQPLSFVKGGKYNNGLFAGRGSSGYCWSFTKSNIGTSAYSFSYYDTSLSVIDRAGMSYGHSLRCKKPMIIWCFILKYIHDYIGYADFCFY